jgi:parallel beta-helix repeat protein
MKKKFLELPIHRKIFFVTIALTVLSAGTFAGIFYAKKAFTSPAPSSPADFRMPSDPFQMRGETSGIGTHFAITDSEYLNITLDSFETIDLRVASIPKVITMMFNRASSTSAAVTKITLAGLLPNTTYYKYEDDYHNLAEFTTDGDGKYSYNQEISVRHFVFIQTVKSTKFIADNATGGDCTTIGTWNQSTKTCTLTTDITETVQIDSDEITLDGNEYSITGTPPYASFAGVFVSDKTGVTVKNFHVNGFRNGIYCYSCINGVISNNILIGNEYDINIFYGSDNTVDHNSISGSDILERRGIFLDSANRNTVHNNTVNAVSYGISLFGDSFGNRVFDNTLKANRMDIDIGYAPLPSVCSNVLTSNIGSGNRPIGFFNSPTTLNGGTFSELILCNANNSDMRNVIIGDGLTTPNNGFLVFHTDHSNFTDIASNGNWTGIYANESRFNTFKNIIADEGVLCAYLVNSDSNVIKNFSANGCSFGLKLTESDNNEIDGMTFDYGMFNVMISRSNSNVIHHSSIYLPSNDVFDCFYDDGGNAGNLLYNNNFTGGPCQVAGMFGNSFNLEKPIGGNYWESYDTSAEGCNDADNDGFCDAPYIIGTGAQDNLPWTTQDGWKGKTVKVAVILAELSDTPHVSNSVTEQPCKLIPAKTYPNGHDKTYYDDMMFCVTDYYRENSYGTANIEATVFPTWYKLRKTTGEYIGKEDQFVQDAVVKSGIDLGGFDVVATVHSGWSEQEKPVSDFFNHRLFTLSFSNLINIAEKDLLGPWAHEIGHRIGMVLLENLDPTPVPDLYKMGMIDPLLFDTEGRWDIMATGGTNKGSNGLYGYNPTLMSSYTKEFMNFLSYDITPKLVYGTFPIDALEQKKAGDKIFRYNLLENANDDNTTPYYVLETRNKTITNTVWDTSIPKNALVAYYVNPKGFPEYGYGTVVDKNGVEHAYINNECRTINIPNGGPLGFPKGGVLSVGETYNDYANLVSISALSDSNSGGKYAINAQIQAIDNTFINNFSGKFKAIVLDSSDTESDLRSASCKLSGIIQKSPNLMPLFYQSIFKLSYRLLVLFAIINLCFWWIIRHYPQWFEKRKVLKKGIFVTLAIFTALVFVIFCFSLLVLVLSGQNQEYRKHQSPKDVYITDSPLTPSTLPDLDLHAITPDGKHVGVNYATGEYENQIQGAIPSGDNQGSPEWILIPEGTEARYYVSAHDNQTFLNENHDIASKMGSTEDSYEVYARYFDPATGIFTGVTVSQTINPGVTDFYQIIGTTTPSVQSNNENATSYLQGIRAYVTVMPFKNKGIKTAYLAQLTVIEKSLAKKKTVPALAVIKALEVETKIHIKTKLIAKTDGEALLGMFAKLRELVKN